MLSPLFSFVIPTSNYGQYIRQCIDRCLEQPVEKEVLVIDGGSDDDTLDVLKTYGDSIRWVSEPDDGQSDAVNKGISMARGEVIAWINSDDYYPPTKPLAWVAREFLEDAETDVVYGEGEYVDERGEPYRRFPTAKSLTVKDLILHPACCLLQPTVFFRRQLFLDVGQLDTSLHYCMDLDLWLRMVPRARRIVRLPHVLACARVHRAAKTRVHIRKTLAQIHAVKRRYRDGLDLTTSERLYLGYGWLKDYAFWLAVTSRLYQVPS